MTTMTTNYATKTAIAATLASLATSSSFLGGRESNQIDNTTNKFVDVLVDGKITVGTTPTANTSINVYVWGAETDITTANIDTLDGVDSAETLTNAGVLYALKLGASITVPAATSDVAYPVQPFSVAQLFGGIMPQYWGLFIAHNTGVNLNATGGNHVLNYTGIKFDVA